MSLREIELELEQLPAEDLRRLALKSWSVFMAKEGSSSTMGFCDEDDPSLLAALDQAMARAEAAPGDGLTGAQLRARLPGWTTR
jgi:hypothetical protein